MVDLVAFKVLQVLEVELWVLGPESYDYANNNLGSFTDKYKLLIECKLKQGDIKWFEFWFGR